MRAVFDDAIMIDAGAGVDDDVAADRAAGVDDGTGGDDGSLIDWHTAGDGGARVNRGGEMEGKIFDNRVEFEARGIIAETEDGVGYALFSQVCKLFFTTENRCSTEGLAVAVGVGVVEEPGDFVPAYTAQDICDHLGMATRAPDHNFDRLRHSCFIQAEEMHRRDAHATSIVL